MLESLANSKEKYESFLDLAIYIENIYNQFKPKLIQQTNLIKQSLLQNIQILFLISVFFLDMAFYFCRFKYQQFFCFGCRCFYTLFFLFSFSHLFILFVIWVLFVANFGFWFSFRYNFLLYRFSPIKNQYMEMVRFWHVLCMFLQFRNTILYIF